MARHLFGLLGIFVLAIPEQKDGSRLSSAVVYEAILAGIGFGLFFALLSETATESAPMAHCCWPNVCRCALKGTVAIINKSAIPANGKLGDVIYAVCDTAANVAFLFALRYGQLGARWLYWPVSILLQPFF